MDLICTANFLKQVRPDLTCVKWKKNYIQGLFNIYRVGLAQSVVCPPLTR